MHTSSTTTLAPGTDGCILFSDILTPLPGMGVDFDILEKVITFSIPTYPYQISFPASRPKPLALSLTPSRAL